MRLSAIFRPATFEVVQPGVRGDRALRCQVMHQIVLSELR